ncbi:hypothetical protein F66182_15426, partial [Fusarium sp. NRRL 66182]
MREAPKITGDIVTPLQQANLKNVLDTSFQSNVVNDTTVQAICDALYKEADKETGLFMTPIHVDVVLINALVLYIGEQAVASGELKGNTRAAFEESPHSM